MSATAQDLRPLSLSPPLIQGRTSLRPALLLAAWFALITFLVHFLSSLWGMHLGYGYFRDEFYFLVCGRHLDWGYVDQPPLVALQARLAEILFGLSPTGIRTFSFLASGITVGLVGSLTTIRVGSRTNTQICAAQPATPGSRTAAQSGGSGREISPSARH